MTSSEPLHCAIDTLGADRVMFSVDYPFESSDEAGKFMDTVPLAAKIRAEPQCRADSRLAVQLIPKSS